MRIFNTENTKTRLEDGFWDNVHEIIIEEIEFSYKKCEFDECPFLAVKGLSFCLGHQKELDNSQLGKEKSNVS
jgi:hypothetical protein